MGQSTNHQIMERLFMIMVICYLCGSIVELSGQAVESPQYRVVHSESDFEVRLYRESSWMSAQVRETTSFEKATKDGFHRLYQYIHGDNLNSSQITMTAPVLTSIVPSVHGPEYYVRLYLSAKYERTPPQPFTELNLQFDKLRSRCIAARKFPGFAKDDDINEEFETLVSSLNKHLNGKPGILKEKSSYTIAQYNASYHVSGRLNEVWMDLSGFTVDC
ncbi:heme-binding protein 2 [Rosa chinensis]|uniref:heme-binding protein 2 n=1 Tax=Rosa chinensis TaxID=74649 RepID=UPI000D097A02|nr:heme-binding protein 2 [Rosa chinensis]